jgi:hypothetical protein
MEYQPGFVNVLGCDVPNAIFDFYKQCGFSEESVKAIATRKLIVNANAFHGRINPPPKPGGCGCGCGH